MFQKLRVEGRKVTHSRKISHPRAGHIHWTCGEALSGLGGSSSGLFYDGESTSPCAEGQREG